MLAVRIGMFTEYVDRATRRASYELIEDGTFVGEIEGFPVCWEMVRPSRTAGQTCATLSKAGSSSGFGTTTRPFQSLTA